MDVTTAFFLGFLQGLTEFLPVSSSGHLVLAEHWFGIHQSTPILFDLILHLATLTAVGIYFRSRIVSLGVTIRHWNSPSNESVHEKEMILGILISTLLTCVVGLAMMKLRVIDLMRMDAVYVGWALVFTGAVLSLTYFFRGKENNGSMLQVNYIVFAVLLGLAQSVALLPGVSRSGMTVCAALILGASRKFSLEYSFMMSIPIILIASVVKLKDGMNGITLLPILVGFTASLVFGYIFLVFLSWFTRHGKLYQFAFYTFPVGLWVIFWL